MAGPTLSSYIRDYLKGVNDSQEPGPFVTISRQLGCDGFAIADMLVEKLNDASEEKNWRSFKNEIIQELAQEAGVSEEMLEKERHAKQGMVRDLVRGIKGAGGPDGYEIRNKITRIIRMIAFDGYAVIVGYGSTAATADLDNGISVRIEAAKEWRIRNLKRIRSITADEAKNKIEKMEIEDKKLQRIYEKQNAKTPAFNIVIDNSAFTNDQIVLMIIEAMKQKKLIQ